MKRKEKKNNTLVPLSCCVIGCRVHESNSCNNGTQSTPARTSQHTSTPSARSPIWRAMFTAARFLVVFSLRSDLISYSDPVVCVPFSPLGGFGRQERVYFPRLSVFFIVSEVLPYAVTLVLRRLSLLGCSTSASNRAASRGHRRRALSARDAHYPTS